MRAAVLSAPRALALGYACAVVFAACSNKPGHATDDAAASDSGGAGGAASGAGGRDGGADANADAGSPGPIAFGALCPADGWCWEHPLPQGNDLAGVWGSGSNDVWAVGDEGAVLHWDGRTFTGVPSGTLDRLTGVWASSSQDAWASGTLGAFLHWDGQGWSPAGQPASVTSADAVAGWVDRSGGAPATEVWFASGTRPIQDRAGTWGYAATALSPSFTVHALWADGAGAVWAAGSAGRVAVEQGGSWTSLGSGIGSTSNVLGLTGDTTGNVWVVAEGGQIARIDSRGVAASFPSGTTSDLHGVWASGPGDAWAVGAAGTLLHFDGVRWQALGSGTSFDLNGVWGAAANDVWAVGARGTIIHFDGTAWTRPNGEATARLNAAWGASLDDVWAVGQMGVILRRQGGVWHSVSSPTTEELTAVWGATASDVWISGYKVVLHWNGSQLSVPAGAPADAIAVSGRASNDVWAISGGAPNHWDGAAWTPQNRMVATSIFEAAANDIWVSAIDGEASAGHWDGQTWTKWPLTECLKVHGSSPTDVWCVGGYTDARIYHWTGAAWQAITSPARVGLEAVAASGLNQMWYAGLGGILGRCDGTTCAGRTPGGNGADPLTTKEFVGEELTGLAVIGGDVFLVGTRGVILHRHP